MAIEPFPPGVTLLVIEDDDTVMQLISRVAEKMGAQEVITAKNGGQGLLSACLKRPTLVVCDLNMSPVDGLSFLAGLRNARDAEISSIPVIIFTADTDTTGEVKASKLGVDGYYRKPFTPTGLSEALAKAARHRMMAMARQTSG